MLSRSFLVFAAAAALSLAPAARASAIVERNVKNPTLKVNKRGYALVQYTRVNGRRRSVVLWGALNGVASSGVGEPQARFKIDYTGGAAFGKPKYWKTFKNACKPYDGPPLVLFVDGCKAPDGSYWALQAWVRLAASRGFDPFKPEHTAVELHLSHWTGPLPVLEVWPNWTYGGTLQGFFGRFMYRGLPVYGTRSPSVSPYGAWLFIDTLNSVYGPGWKRDTALATHTRNGGFCYSFVRQYPPNGYPSHTLRGPGLGDRHRITAAGPGVTPIVQWEGARLGPYDPVEDGRINKIFDSILVGDKKCERER
jgi:hypothetical protein